MNANRKTARMAAVHPDGYPYAELSPLARAALEAGVSVLLRGHPGVGKSALAAELAADMDLPLHDIRLAQCEPAEIGGVYFPDRERQELSLLPPTWVREVCSKPGFIFLDEINAAVTRLHQAAAYQIVLERRVGPFRFHPGTVVMAAGNLEEDRAIVSPLSSALNNRFAHFRMRIDLQGWLQWALRQGISPIILAYMRAHAVAGPRLLYDNDGSDAFPTPRSWEMASRLLEHAPAGQEKRCVAACVGAEASERFFAFHRLWTKVRPDRIIRNGKFPDFTASRSADPSLVQATVSAVGAWLIEQEVVEDAWLSNLLAFLELPGLDPEYVFLLLRELRAKSDLTERLKSFTIYRRMASDLVQLHVGLYA